MYIYNDVRVHPLPWHLDRSSVPMYPIIHQQAATTTKKREHIYNEEQRRPFNYSPEQNKNIPVPQRLHRPAWPTFNGPTPDMLRAFVRPQIDICRGIPTSMYLPPAMMSSSPFEALYIYILSIVRRVRGPRHHLYKIYRLAHHRHQPPATPTSRSFVQRPAR